MHWNVIRKRSVTSTNDVLRELAASGAPDGTVAVSDEQTGGRGSRGRKWLSPPGVNLYASILLYPNLPPAKTVELAFVAAVSVAEALRLQGLDARIKWPNDVLVKGRKICGILIETVMRAGEMPAVIIGIGINVNWLDLDEEIARAATSIALELGESRPVDEVLDCLLNEFGPLYEAYLREGMQPVMARWRELQCTIGQKVKVALEGRTIEGKAIDVDDGGSLIVETESGVITVTAAGTLLPEDNGG